MIDNDEDIYIRQCHAFIYEKFQTHSNKDNSETYSYICKDVRSGNEIKFGDLLVFNYEDELGNTHEVNVLKNGMGEKTEYVYAFPFYTEELTDHEKEDLLMNLEEIVPILREKLIFQSINNDENHVFYFTNKKAKSIDTTLSKSIIDLVKSIEGEKMSYTESLATVKSPKKQPQPMNEYKDVLYSDDIYENVSKTVICQDDQVKKIATALAKNSRINNPALKSNILVCGPTGTGKSLIFKTISELYDLPISMEDATEYTASSYKGKDVSEMLLHLYQNANGDIKKAQRGILIVDEIDKKVSKGSDHDTYTTAVITSLLKMMEGHKYHVENGMNKSFEFDTSKLTFAFLGAFSGIEEYSRTKRGIGFSMVDEEKENKDNVNYYNDETLKKYGMLPEFIGRNDTLVVMNSLDEKDFARIIKESDKSQLMLYKELYEDMGIRFLFDDETILAIAKKAKSLGLGARSIKQIIERALEVANYYVLSSNKYKELQITPETLEDNKKFILR